MSSKTESIDTINKNFVKWNIPIPKRTYMVVVHCSTYNHEKYVEDAIKGFVMQRTNFPFCAIIIDDGSSDKTPDIVREYAQKHPDIIKPICLGYNHMQHGLSRNPYFEEWHNSCKYLALCEGDDYWTDPYKLQKQVDFMEKNVDFSICYHKVKVWDDKSNSFVLDPVIDDNVANSSIVNLSKGNYIHTLSVLYRRNIYVEPQKRLGYVIAGDYLTNMLYAEHGKIHRIDDYMGVYRQGVGVWTKNADPMRQSVDWLIAISKLYSVLTNEEAKKVLDDQIQIYRKSIIELYRESVEQEKMARSSKSYRLGRFLLHPFSIFKKK